jgi:hypothetical protein
MTAETYTHNDREFYVDTHRPVWPHRIREVPNGADPTPALNDDDSVIHTLHALDRLERATRPSSGLNAEGKDLAAFRALRLAAGLIRDIAGWAIDHQFGKAKNGYGFAPISIQEQMEFDRQPDLDNHSHEKTGRECVGLDPIEARQFLLNMLRPMGHALRIPKNVIDGLEALQFGETLPIFMKAPTAKRSGLTEYRAKLAAIAFIAFENEKGVKKHVSTQEVADEFLVTEGSVNDGKVELRTALGAAEVDRVLEMAQAFGRAVLTELREDRPPGIRHHLEDQFGRPALQRAAESYKARSRKNLKKVTKPRE